MSNLLQNLRALARGDNDDHTLGDEAADLIETLCAGIEELRETNEQLREAAKALLKAVSNDKCWGIVMKGQDELEVLHKLLEEES